ncbi:ATP-binding protein [Streptomyces sp. NPDC046465]|uniref:ATP-binding protein n=1 Tax=Streptomyces sp. NPDC046465 TaxID=3155810 RepID=UPI0033E0A9C7
MGVPEYGTETRRREPGLPQTYTLFTPGGAQCAKICRDFVHGSLETLGLGHLSDTAALCTSELVTNVHRHTLGDVHLRTSVAMTHVRVAVYDGNERLPSPRRALAEDDCGRGLFLVGALSDLCGVTPVGVGKGVWFQLNR